MASNDRIDPRSPYFDDYLDSLIAKGGPRSEVLAAVRNGTFAYALALASSLKSEKFDPLDLVEIICAFYKEGCQEIAIMLGHRWHVSAKVPRGLNKVFDTHILPTY